MSFPEKIQLATGVVAIASAVVGYLSFSFYYRKINRAELISFLRYLVVASICIGSHQVFEFLSLTTGSQIIYKIGLIISISGMIFYLISLEKLYNRDLHSKFFAFFIPVIAIYLFLKPVEFTTVKFHLEHHSIFLWSLAWFIIFMYWNIVILFEQRSVGKNISMMLAIAFMMCSMTISFLLSSAYSIWNYYIENINICTTYPSVWCTFGVMQVIFVPFFLFYLPKKMKKMPPKTKLSIRNRNIYIFIAIIITVLSAALLSRTACFNIEFILS